MANVTTKHASAALSNKGTAAASPTLTSNTFAAAVKPKDGGWAAVARGGSSSKVASLPAASSTPASRSSVASTLPAKTNSAAAGSSSISNPKETKIPSFNSEEVNKYLQLKFQEYYKLAKDAKSRHAEYEIAIFKPAESGWISNDSNHKKNASKNTSNIPTSSGAAPANGNPAGKALTHTFLSDIARSL